MSALEVFKYSVTGSMPPLGNLDDAEAIIAFPFGRLENTAGDYIAPGATNLALAEYIANNAQLREKNIVLTEELADALDGDTDGSITLINNINKDGRTSSTYDYAVRAGEHFRQHNIGQLAVVAFRHHLPKANAGIKRVGLKTVVPDLRQVGNFDPESAQWWTRNLAAWIVRESVVLPVSLALRQI
jgi:hypothetical protein